ncbi:ubiquinol oxidase subunit II [Paenibacillus yanchengensis]|uniref:Quinol oxidase subunit 2 n=1 Tax=Paenibacillus yanchengensis TaxID=2035833 RepID=A0ABW4YJJ5_9BACL
MNLKKGLRWIGLFSMLMVLLVVATGCTENIIILDPKGPIAAQQRDLMVIATILVLIIIIPVLLLTVFIVWRYRDKKGSKAKYAPNWAHSTSLELIWWSIPVVIIIILGAVTVKYTYALEPSKPIESEKEELVIQVTSLDWKWLFQYPDQDIATINHIVIPEDVPVRFEITADGPMNSFWIPQLGGQMYAMSGMAMVLYLEADESGNYWGSGANFTGRDFAKMYFDVKATSEEEFDKWVDEIKTSQPKLTQDGYEQIRLPAASEQMQFSAFPDQLFENTVNKYAASHRHHMAGSSSDSDKQHDDQLNEQHEASESNETDATHSGH